VESAAVTGAAVDGTENVDVGSETGFHPGIPPIHRAVAGELSAFGAALNQTADTSGVLRRVVGVRDGLDVSALPFRCSCRDRHTRTSAESMRRLDVPADHPHGQSLFHH
jgi:hypothetical protein